MIPEEYIEIAHTRKTYGVDGALKLVCEPPWDEVLPHLRAVFIEVEGGLLPFFVAEVRTTGTAIIRFEDIRSPEAAKPLAGQPIFARPKDVEPFLDEDSLPGPTLPEQLEGLQVHDQNLGLVGTIEAVREMPQQLMAVITYKGQERLIPLHEDLILEIDPKKGIIQMDLPEGLLTL